MSRPKRTSRTRTRPRRAHPHKRSVDSSSPPPVPAKKRTTTATTRPRHENPRAQVFAIKDIIDEKWVKGKRYFKIDWADDPTTRQSFEPSWEPEENANQEAVDDSEAAKNKRNQLHDNVPPEPSPAFYVQVPSKSVFLNARPDFDHADILSLTSSQLSQFPPPGAETQLPPSQFFIVSSQPSQDAVIADSQPPSTLTTQSQQPAPGLKPKGCSQTTIPDSQDFFTDFSQDPIEVPYTVQESHHTTSASSIPSRQPDDNLVSFGNYSISTGLEHTRESQENSTAPQPASNLPPPPPSIPESSRIPFSGFLTQPEFPSGEFSLSSKSHQETQPDEAAALPENRLAATPGHDTTLLDDSHQPAQRVAPFHADESPFLTQSEPEFFSASGEDDFVPPTSPRNSGASEQQLGPSQHAILPATSNHGTFRPPVVRLCRTSFYAPNHHEARLEIADFLPYIGHGDLRQQDTFYLLAKSNQLMMDESQPAAPEPSGLDALRVLQLEFLRKPVDDSLDGFVGSTGHDARGDRGHNNPTPVSPSDIINSVEQDGLDTLDHAHGPAVAGPGSWVQAPGPMLYTGPLESHHAPSAAAESNSASLATTTPASGAIDHTSDVEMTFTAAALANVLEPGLAGSGHALATVTPSELLAPTAASMIPGAAFHPDQPFGGAATDHTEGPGVQDTVMEDGDEFGILPEESTAANEYIVALPPPTRKRAEALEIINVTYREDIAKFRTLFTCNLSASSDHKTVARIDLMRQSLTEMSNLPAYYKDLALAGLAQEGWVKYARDTCSKLAFVYEFLDHLRAFDVEVAILAATGPIMEKIEAIVKHGDLAHRRANDQEWVPAPPERGSSCKVVLVDTAQGIPRSRLTANVLVAYDETAETSGILSAYKTRRDEDQEPLILSLVEVYSVEHINRRLSPHLKPLEKRFAQVSSLVSLSRYTDDEHAYELVPQPHEVARELVEHMVHEDRFQPIPSRWEGWGYQRIAEDVFDDYKTARMQMAAHEGRKRARGDSGPGSESPKRARLASPDDEAQPSEEVKARFGNDVRVKDGVAQVSIEKLEDLIGLVKDLKIELDKKGKQVKGYEKSIQKFQPKYLEAIGDRGSFELQRDRAVKDRDKALKDLERTQARVDKLSEEKHDLESRLSELARSSEHPDQAAAAQREIEVREAVEKAASVERQIQTIRADLDFAQQRYRDASNKAAALGEENSELKLQIRGLEARASANVVEIRKINAARTDTSLRKMYDQEKAMRQAHEREIDRIKEELRVCKSRFGGRETRGSSVPRSPRPSRQMSSRNTSPVGDGNGGGGSGSGSGNGGGGGNGNGGGGGGGGAMASVFGPRGSHLRDL